MRGFEPGGSRPRRLRAARVAVAGPLVTLACGGEPEGLPLDTGPALLDTDPVLGPCAAPLVGYDPGDDCAAWGELVEDAGGVSVTRGDVACAPVALKVVAPESGRLRRPTVEGAPVDVAWIDTPTSCWELLGVRVDDGLGDGASVEAGHRIGAVLGEPPWSRGPEVRVRPGPCPAETAIPRALLAPTVSIRTFPDGYVAPDAWLAAGCADPGRSCTATATFDLTRSDGTVVTGVATLAGSELVSAELLVDGVSRGSVAASPDDRTRLDATWTFETAGLADGPHDLEIRAVDAAGCPDGARAWSDRVTVPWGLPYQRAVTARAATVRPSSAHRDEQVTVEATFDVVASTPLDPLRVTFRLSDDATLDDDDLVLGSADVTVPRGASTVTASRPFAPSDLALGPAYVIAVASPGVEHPAPSTADDVVAARFEILPARGNLRVVSVTPSATEQRPDEAVVVAIDVVNDGTIDVPSFGGLLFADPPSAVFADPLFLWGDPLPPGSGQTLTVSVPWDHYCVPVSEPWDGTCMPVLGEAVTPIVELDASGDLPEADETDNVGFGPAWTLLPAL